MRLWLVGTDGSAASTKCIELVSVLAHTACDSVEVLHLSDPNHPGIAPSAAIKSSEQQLMRSAIGTHQWKISHFSLGAPLHLPDRCNSARNGERTLRQRTSLFVKLAQPQVRVKP